MYEAKAKLIKRKAFWYFLSRGIFLKKLKLTITSQHGNSYNDRTNYYWWPRSYGDSVKICFNANKLGIVDLQRFLNKESINQMVAGFYVAYKRAIKRRNE